MDQGALDRKQWIDWLLQIGEPVLVALKERKLKETMPVQGKLDDRGDYTYLEALGRLLCGLAPWLEATGLSAEEEAATESHS